MASDSETDLIICASPRLDRTVRSPAAAGSSTGTSVAVPAESALLNLPLDVLTIIFETCDWPEAVALRRTCRQFRSSFPVMRTIQKAKAYRQILADQDTGVYPAPCYGCLRVLPQNRFPSGWAGIDGEPLGRRCTYCALASQLLPAGVKYEVKGVMMVLCKGCGRQRRENGRCAPEKPAGYCPRCRRLVGFAKWLGNRQRSAPFYAVMLSLAVLILSAFTFRAIVIAWDVLPNDDHAIQDFAFFTAIYQSTMQVFWLTIFTLARFLPTQNRWRRKAFKLVTCGGIAAETFLEFICLLVSCCMPFTMGYFASVRVIAWATVTWCVASFGAIVRMIAEDDLKTP